MNVKRTGHRPQVGRSAFGGHSVAAHTLMLAAVFACGCSDVPQGVHVQDPELEGLLRPVQPINEEQLVRGRDGKVYYSALLSKTPALDFEEQYLLELEERGFRIEGRTNSPHVFPQEIEGYKVDLTQEVDLDPYTIRYKVSWDGRDPKTKLEWVPRGNFPHPISVSGRTLVLRLDERFLDPWKVVVVVPERHQATPRLPIPLPAGAVILRVEERHGSERFEGESHPAQDPDEITMTFLVRSEPRQVIEFYRTRAEGYGTVFKDNPTDFSWHFDQGPPWAAPRKLKRLYLAAQNTLFSRDGVAVPDARTVKYRSPDWQGEYQAKTLQNIPPDVFSYLFKVDFKKDESEQ